MLIDHIKQHLNALPSEEAAKLRASGSGKCTRQLAYNYHGFKPKPLNWRAHLVFDLGNTVESQLAAIVTQYGLTDVQKECSVEIDGVKIYGHIDGIYQDSVVDFKSCTTFAFKDARKGQIGDYLYQITFYMKALGLKKGIVVYYCKETSALHEVHVSYDVENWALIEDKFKRVIGSTKDNLTARDYGPSAKTGKLPWQCSYCGHCEACWPGAELSFDLDGKPQLHVNKE